MWFFPRHFNNQAVLLDPCQVSQHSIPAEPLPASEHAGDGLRIGWFRLHRHIVRPVTALLQRRVAVLGVAGPTRFEATRAPSGCNM